MPSPKRSAYDSPRPLQYPPTALSVPHFTKTTDGYIFVIRVVVQRREAESFTVHRTWDALLDFSQRMSEAFPAVVYGQDTVARPLPRLQRKMSLFVTRSTMQSRRDELDLWLRRLVDGPDYICASPILLSFFADDSLPFNPSPPSSLAPPFSPMSPARPMLRAKHSVPDMRFSPDHYDPHATIRPPPAAHRRPQLDMMRTVSEHPDLMQRCELPAGRAGAVSPISSVSSSSSTATIRPTPPGLRKFISLQDINLRNNIIPTHPNLPAHATPRAKRQCPMTPTIAEALGPRSRSSSNASLKRITPPPRSREGSLSAASSSNRTSSDSDRSPRTPPSPFYTSFSTSPSSSSRSGGLNSSLEALDFTAQPISRPYVKDNTVPLFVSCPFPEEWSVPATPTSPLSPLPTPKGDTLAVKIRHPAMDTIIAVRVSRKTSYSDLTLKVAAKLGEDPEGLALAAPEDVGETLDEATWAAMARDTATKATLVVVGVSPASAC